jgi:hypothetical protein
MSHKAIDTKALIRLEIPDYVRQMTFTVTKTRFIAIMALKHFNRGMIASEFHTRCVRRGEVHELICVKEHKDGLIDLNDAWYLGFIEFTDSCVLAKGMLLKIKGKIIGKLIAFDMTHAPNHLNILLASHEPQTGEELSIQLNEISHFEY